MKRMMATVFSVLAIAVCAFTQAPDDAIQKALLTAPRQTKEGATVIKWKPDLRRARFSSHCC
jgi:hypothetical protein